MLSSELHRKSLSASSQKLELIFLKIVPSYPALPYTTIMGSIPQVSETFKRPA